MKKIAFVGAFDKTDLIIYIAKILTELGKKVLVIDTTVLQKARYIVPAIAPTKNYVTEYENMDISVGFSSFEMLDSYIGDIQADYDITLIDIDTYEMFDSFEANDADKIYFVTAFDSFSLKRGMEIIGTMRNQVSMKKILFEREILEENDEYLNQLSINYPIHWEKEKIHFPYDQGDLTAIIENQLVSKIKFKNLSSEYKDGLTMVVQDIIPEVSFSELRKIFKNL